MGLRSKMFGVHDPWTGTLHPPPLEKNQKKIPPPPAADSPSDSSLADSDEAELDDPDPWESAVPIEDLPTCETCGRIAPAWESMLGDWHCLRCRPPKPWPKWFRRRR